MIYFPNNDEEISLLKFLSNYQYLSIYDTKYFFKSQWYYKKRISNLIEKEYIKKIQSYYALDTSGIEYINYSNFPYNERNRNKKYQKRLMNISHFAAFFYNSQNVKFKPSFDIKDSEILTSMSRRYIGKANINDYEYLIYYIQNIKDIKYITSVIFDIQKERNYKNIIIILENISQIDINNFTFGLNSVLLINNSEIDKEKLNHLHNINWYKVVQTYYKNSVYLADYNFCDYTDYKNKYISYFYFVDTEKINRIKYFLRENKDKEYVIICPANIKPNLQKELPSAKFIEIALEDYIEKEQRTYS